MGEWNGSVQLASLEPKTLHLLRLIILPRSTRGVNKYGVCDPTSGPL